MMNGIIVVSVVLLSYVVIKLGLPFLKDHGFVQSNYQGKPILVGLGWIMWLHLLLYTGLSQIFQFPSWLAVDEHVVLMLTVVFLAGWMDDTIGDRGIKGFKGHVLMLVRYRTFSTGILKLILIGWMSLWASWNYSEQWFMILVTSIGIALSSNSINLFDLRPGRALKVFFLVSSILILYGAYTHKWYELNPLWPLLISAVWVFPFDLRGHAMLGDMGANMLGFCLGYTAVVLLPDRALCIWMIILLVLHGYAERASISSLIERVPFLAWLDRLGRGTS